MTTEKSIRLVTRLKRQAESAQASLDKFKEKFAQDPAYALEWSLDTFRQAAELRTLLACINDLESGATVEQMTHHLMSNVLHKSKYPPQSTSPTSNLMEQYTLAACANLLSYFKDFE